MATTFVPSERDLIDANLLWLRLELRKAGNQLFLLSGAVLFALIAWHAASDADFRPRLAAAGLGVLLWIAAVGLILGIRRLSLPRRTRRQLRQQKSLQSEARLSWSEDGIQFETAEAHSRHAWGEFASWAESETIILLFHADKIFHFIPKRALSASEIDDLRALLRRKVTRKSAFRW